VFHLMTHAFFKALLFLGSGSVIHAMSGEQDMRNMGGLRQRLPWTHRTMLVGCIAIAGVPPLAGFFSKDEILWSAYKIGGYGQVVWIMGFVVAAMTAFYMFRLYHMTFSGAFRGTAEQLKHLEAVNIGAAGTFVIRRPGSQAQLRDELTRRLPFAAEIMICTDREIAGLMSQNHFADQPLRPDIVRFVSVLSKRPHSAPSTPMSFPANGEWLLKILARDGRFLFGVYRRHMKAISYLGTLDRLFGVPVTTRNWNTVTAIAKMLGNWRTEVVPGPVRKATTTTRRRGEQ